MKQLGTFLIVLLALQSCIKNTNDLEKGTRAIVYNKGVPGNTTLDLLKRTDRDVVAFSPNLVIIMIGTNDVAKKITPSEYEINLTLLINRIKKTGSDILLLSPPPRGTDTINNQVETYFNKRTLQIAAIMDTLGKALGCYYLDINTAFKDAGTPNPTASSLLFNYANNPARPDGVHPTNEGSLFIAKNVFNFMQSNMPIKKYKVVVCFGDSITKGSGGGAKSYPQQLEDMLNQ